MSEIDDITPEQEAVDQNFTPTEAVEPSEESTDLMARLDAISQQYRNEPDDPNPTADTAADPSPDDSEPDPGEDQEFATPPDNEAFEQIALELAQEMERSDTPLDLGGDTQDPGFSSNMLNSPAMFPPVGICELTSAVKWKELYATSAGVTDYIGGRIVTDIGRNQIKKLNSKQGVFLAFDNLSATQYVFIPNSPFEVDVTQIGGTQGILTSASQTYASFNYKAKLKGTSIVLIASAAPAWHRYFPGPVNSATNGLAVWDGTNPLRLLSVDESIKTSVFVTCSS